MPVWRSNWSTLARRLRWSGHRTVTAGSTTSRCGWIPTRTDSQTIHISGITVGRFANRIGGARFTLEGVEYQLVANEGANMLHGGPAGFGKVRWTGEPHGEDTVGFTRVSPDGDMGFPGSMTTTVTYRLVGSTLTIDHEATTDAPTICSLTNHAYWNLGGPSEATIDNHVVTIDASSVVPIDDALIPDGEPVPVEGPFDLRQGAHLATRIGFPLPNGYDHCFMVDGDGLRRHARRAPGERPPSRGVVRPSRRAVLHRRIPHRSRWRRPSSRPLRRPRHRASAGPRRSQPTVGTKRSVAPR